MVEAKNVNIIIRYIALVIDAYYQLSNKTNIADKYTK